MDIIRWGIIGCGNVCEVKSAPAMYKIEHSELVAVMRRDVEKAQDFAKRHSVGTYYTDADRLINDPQVNIVYIATPPSSHKEYAIRALKAGKPVYVEKPMAMNYSECMEMVKTAQEVNQKLYVAYYRRELPYFQKIKELLDSGIIGKVLCVDINYFRPASELDQNTQNLPWRLKKEFAGEGYFLDLASHTLDILDFLLGEIEDAKGFSLNRGGYYEVADSLSASFKFRSGALATGLWNFVSSEESKKDNINILGTEGEISFNTFSFQPIRVTTQKKGVKLYETSHPEHIQQPLIQTIVNELRGMGICPSTGTSAARTSRVMDCIIQ